MAKITKVIPQIKLENIFNLKRDRKKTIRDFFMKVSVAILTYNHEKYIRPLA
jgi:hypothetical protein